MIRSLSPLHYPSLNITDKNIRYEYKKWFIEQKEYWGRNCNKVFKQWKKDNPEATQKFFESFIKAYNYLARRNNLPLI